MKSPTIEIRHTHHHGFRCGQWGSLHQTEPDKPYYEVWWDDGVFDLWPKNEANLYELRFKPDIETERAETMKNTQQILDEIDRRIENINTLPTWDPPEEDPARYGRGTLERLKSWITEPDDDHSPMRVELDIAKSSLSPNDTMSCLKAIIEEVEERRRDWEYFHDSLANQGARTRALEERIEELEKKLERPKVIYTMAPGLEKRALEDIHRLWTKLNDVERREEKRDEMVAELQQKLR